MRKNKIKYKDKLIKQYFVTKVKALKKRKPNKLQKHIKKNRAKVKMVQNQIVRTRKIQSIKAKKKNKRVRY